VEITLQLQKGIIIHGNSTIEFVYVIIHGQSTNNITAYVTGIHIVLNIALSINIVCVIQ